MHSMDSLAHQRCRSEALADARARLPAPAASPGVRHCQETAPVLTSAAGHPSAAEPVSRSSVCSAQRAPVAFDSLLLDVQAAVQPLLDEQGATGDDVVLVQNPEDLRQDALVLRVSLMDGGGLVREPGRLLRHARPLCLVLDCRKLSAAQLTAYNDLLDPDQPSLYDRCSKSKQPLGDHVRILVLLSQQQYLAETDAASCPGQDFWRRVARPGLTLEWTGPAADPDLLPPCHTGELSYENGLEVIDFHHHGDWRRTLYGWLGTDDHGRMCFCVGALARLRAGQRVVLRGADWSDPVFCHEWLKIQRTGFYDSNGCQCRLPDGLSFVRSTLDAAERQWLGQCISRQKHPGQESIVVNQYSLPQWLAQGCVNEEGRWQQADALQERLARGAGLIVSSPLGEAGWLSLLSHLRGANRGLAGIGVFLAHDDPADGEVVPQLAAEKSLSVSDDNSDKEEMESDQMGHQALSAAEAVARPVLAGVLSPRVRIRSWQDSDQITAWLEQQRSSAVQPLVIRVHP
ncbi:MAG: hypothetical protein OXC07_09905, partial [Kistimonas sp.]|nr:hypothetical protein [Kistimonas sp.]